MAVWKRRKHKLVPYGKVYDLYSRCSSKNLVGDDVLRVSGYRVNRTAALVGLGAFMLIFTILLSYKPILRNIYQIHHMDLIRAHAENSKLDPYLVAAIISVESSFQPNAVSPKGAIGLMQVMPNTGVWAATYLGLDEFETDQLFEPDINICIGVWCLTRLIREFDSNVPVALASYNGGEANVRQWLSNGTWSGSVDDIERIPFPETRRYVEKVLAMYSYYKWLY